MGLVGGQALDLEAEEKGVDLAAVEVIHVRKTGALMLAAIRIGARLGGATDWRSREAQRVTVNISDWLSRSPTIFWTRAARRSRKRRAAARSRRRRPIRSSSASSKP